MAALEYTLHTSLVTIHYGEITSSNTLPVLLHSGSASWQARGQYSTLDYNYSDFGI